MEAVQFFFDECLGNLESAANEPVKVLANKFWPIYEVPARLFVTLSVLLHFIQTL